MLCSSCCSKKTQEEEEQEEEETPQQPSRTKRKITKQNVPIEHWDQISSLQKPYGSQFHRASQKPFGNDLETGEKMKTLKKKNTPPPPDRPAPDYPKAESVYAEPVMDAHYQVPVADPNLRYQAQAPAASFHVAPNPNVCGLPIVAQPGTLPVVAQPGSFPVALPPNTRLYPADIYGTLRRSYHQQQPQQPHQQQQQQHQQQPIYYESNIYGTIPRANPGAGLRMIASSLAPPPPFTVSVNSPAAQEEEEEASRRPCSQLSANAGAVPKRTRKQRKRNKKKGGDKLQQREKKEEEADDSNGFKACA